MDRHLDNLSDEKKPGIAHLQCALQEQLENITKLDKDIIDLLYGGEGPDDETIAKEIEACELNGELRHVLKKIEEVLPRER